MNQAPFLLPLGAAMCFAGAFGCGGTPSGPASEPTAVAPIAAQPAAPMTAPTTALAPEQPAPAMLAAGSEPPALSATTPATPPLPAPTPGTTPPATPSAATMAGYPDLSGIHTLPLPNEPSAPPADQTGLAAVLGATPPPSTPSGPRTYALDPAKSSLYVQVYKDPNTIGQGLSHDHVVAATGWSGSVVWDRAHTEGCAVRVTVPVQGLVNDALGLRKRVGYDTTLTEDQRAEVKQHMLAPGQLDAGAFPTITFLATGCSGPLDTDGNGAVTVTGVFTLHGIAKTIAPKMTIHLDDHSFSARGSFTVNTTDFGFEPYTALLGALKNNNALKFTVDVSGTSG